MTRDQTASEAHSPHRRATAQIASTALATPLGDRLPNITELRETVQVGTGTVQTVLRQLQEQGAMSLDTQKRRGTFLVAKDIGALWRASGASVLNIVMPLPSAWEFLGLSAGLQAEFERLGIPISIMHSHGSTNRLSLLNRGPGMAVMSAYAAERQAPTSETVTAVNLPAGTYYAQNSVVVLSRRTRSEVPDDARVGIDPNSADHLNLTKAEFPDRDYIDVSYPQVPVALRKGLIDVAVWHRTALWLSLDDQMLRTSQLQQHSAIDIAEKTSAGAFVARKQDGVTLGILREISLDRVITTQAELIEGRLAP